MQGGRSQELAPVQPHLGVVHRQAPRQAGRDLADHDHAERLSDRAGGARPGDIDLRDLPALVAQMVAVGAA